MTAAGIERAIEAGVDAMQQTLPAGAGRKLAALITALERWNARINLTAIRDTGAMVSGHVLDSLSVRELIEGHAVVDVGTGAGFPGLPLAIAEPSLDVHLIDSSGKKIAFVEHMIGELAIKNATAVRARIERYAPGVRFDTVMARAFAPLPRFVRQTGHLIGDTGVLLALKGKYPASELADVESCGEPWDFEVTELTVPGREHHARHAVTLWRRTVTQI